MKNFNNIKTLLTFLYINIFVFMSFSMIEPALKKFNFGSIPNKYIIFFACYGLVLFYGKENKRRILMLISNLCLIVSAYLKTQPYAEIMFWVSLSSISLFYLSIVLELVVSFFSLFNKQAKVFKQKRGIVDPRSKDFYSSEAWRKLRPVVFSMYGNQCMNPKCGNVNELQIDHIKPRSKFPQLALDLNNLQVLCGPCNRKKSNVEIIDYR